MAGPVPVRDRLAAVGLLLLLMAAAYFVFVHPWFTRPLLAVNAELAALREREQRVQQQLALAPQLRERLTQARGQLEERAGFLPERSREAASAALVQRLETAVQEASPGNRSCAISNRSPLPANDRDSRFARVAVQVRLRCGVPEMAQVLHQLESGTPQLFVDNLNLLAQRFQASPQETGTGIDVAFELYGHLAPGSADGADGGDSDPAAEGAPASPDEQAAPPMPVEPDAGEAADAG